jgi:hypothetical protein
VALAAEAQTSVARAMRVSAARGQRLATLSIAADIRFESAAERQAFTEALQAAITAVVGRHTSSATTGSGQPGAGRPFKLLVACYPSSPSDSQDKSQS